MGLNEGGNMPCDERESHFYGFPPPVKITTSTMLKIFANDGMMLSAVS